MGKDIDMIIKEDSCCIISKSFKDKLEDINNRDILIGDILEDDNNKVCVIEILPDDELLKRCEDYDNKVYIVKETSNDTNFHPVTHTPKIKSERR